MFLTREYNISLDKAMVLFKYPLYLRIDSRDYFIT